MIYSINFSIGWASSGVEYAQRYRARVFKHLGIPAKFLYLDFIDSGNFYELVKNIGINPDDSIWIYNYLCGIKSSKCSITVEKFLKTTNFEIKGIKKNNNFVTLILENAFVNIFLDNNNKEMIYKVEYVENGILVKKEYYSYLKYCTEYFVPENNKAKLIQRSFYNEKGNIELEEYFEENNSIIVYRDQIFYDKVDLYKCFVSKLNVKTNDIVIIDRSAGIAQALLEMDLKCKIGNVVHADHYSNAIKDDEQILWNNFYEYMFTHATDIDYFIVSTKGQKNLLQDQFLKYRNIKPKIYQIPVGNIEKLTEPKNKRKPYSLVTASRLASEKHIDWLVYAVAKAKKSIPELTLDIYGEGVEKNKIMDAIKNCKAQDYIKLKGHQDIEDILCNYEVYVSASTSEGFGLSLMEAVASGLAMIGFNIQYGNTTFVSNNNNGILIDSDIKKINKNKGIELSDAILKLYKDFDINKLSKFSYKMAKEYLTEEVSNKWMKFIKENS